MSAGIAQRGILPGELSEIGVRLPPNLSFEDWRDALHMADLIQRASPWWTVDLMAYGAARFGEQHSQALPTAEEDPTGERQARIKQAAWMATKYPTASTRVPSLSYTHHRAVAELDADERRSLLEYAAREHLSTRELIALVKERQHAISAPVVAAETTCAADQVWVPAVSDLAPDARAALEFKAATTAGVRDRESFAAGFLAALHWVEASDCFERWGDDDGTAVFGPAVEGQQ